MIKVVLVGAGGFCGAVARHLLGLLIFSLFPIAFPLGTLIINFAGAFFIGGVFQFSLLNPSANTNLICFLTAGLLGGFTTFSTFSFETVTLFESGKLQLALVNIFASVILCLTGVLLGKAAMRLILN